MASINSDPNGCKRIQFFHPITGKRPTLRLGDVDIKSARSVLWRVETIVAAMEQGVAINADTAAWLSARPDAFYKKLVKAGLAEPRLKTSAENAAPGTQLGAFLTGYLDTRKSAKPTTLTVWGQTKRYLIDYFGSDRAIESITPGDAEEWSIWLRERKNLRDKQTPRTLSKTTVNKRIGFAKQFFAFAVKKRLIAENPFADLNSNNLANRSRDYFVTRSEAEAVLEACPDAEWRLIFALSRYGGLRCPSEHLALRWADIDWERGRMRVRSPKTEHHEGGESRVMPIFPELRPYLDAIWDDPETEGAEFVIQRSRRGSINLRQTMFKIIERAGLTPWPKLFHNLRATRQTELEEQFPTHVVCSWLGNSQSIAKKHYLQVTDAHFEKATQNLTHQVATLGNFGEQSDEEPDKKSKTCKPNAELASTCTSNGWRIGDSNP